MIVSAKAISSPGRTEKLLQPPLMLRFLRSNVGSKSGRSRSRASPMLFRSKKNTVIETNQEPSSPKVSCIGQVRARRSNPTGRSKRTRFNRHCWWFRRALLFSHKKLNRPRSLRRLRHVWRKWVLFFRFGHCKKVDIREEFLESSSKQENQKRVEELEEDGREEFVTISPPKNAFLLTRCRSAPYRSSSLACRFEEDEAKKKKEGDEEQEQEGERESVGPSPSPSHPSSSSRVDDGNEENDLRGKFGISNGRNSEGGVSVRGRARDAQEGGGGGGGPLIVLTRCKSEPARTGEKLISITQNKVGFC